MERAADQRAVLVVEDEGIIRMFAAGALQDAGYQVLEAQDAAEPLEILARNPEISLLVTDVRMPGELDGHPEPREAASEDCDADVSRHAPSLSRHGRVSHADLRRPSPS